MSITALHGFLGDSRDWDFLQKFNCLTPSLLSFPSTFEGFVTQINRETSSILIGYSLGGRLALHALLAEPKQYKAAVIISSHPGLKEGKRERLINDQKWAEKLLNNSWDFFISEWNKQPIFAESSFLQREEPQDKDGLAERLVGWSLGLQENLRDQISTLTIPILWVVGEKDLTYLSLARELTFQHSLSRIEIIKNAGHRVLWDNPAQLSLTIEQFLQCVG